MAWLEHAEWDRGEDKEKDDQHQDSNDPARCIEFSDFIERFSMPAPNEKEDHASPDPPSAPEKTEEDQGS